MSSIVLGQSNGCWIDLWGGRAFRGWHARLVGPVALPHLRLASGAVGRELGSLEVGPAAYVQCYDAARFDDTVFWLLPNQAVGDVDDLIGCDRADSMCLWDRPPFAHEPGYAAYMLWAASHITRCRDPAAPVGDVGGASEVPRSPTNGLRVGLRGTRRR